MTKAKEKKEKNNKKNNSNTEKNITSFDYIKYVEKTFERPKSFLYYILINDLTLKSKEEVDKAYKLYKQLGGE